MRTARLLNDDSQYEVVPYLRIESRWRGHSHKQRRAERRRAPRHKVNEMTNEERFLLNLIRREDRSLKNFTLTLTADGDDCRATLQSHDSGGAWRAPL